MLVTGLWLALGRLIGRMLSTIARAMLAGVIRPLCLEPAAAAYDRFWAVVPVIMVWLIAPRFSTRWAVPVASSDDRDRRRDTGRGPRRWHHPPGAASSLDRGEYGRMGPIS